MPSKIKKYDLIIGLATILELQLLKIYAGRLMLNDMFDGENQGWRDKSTSGGPCGENQGWRDKSTRTFSNRPQTSNTSETEVCSAVIPQKQVTSNDNFEQFIESQYAGEDEITPKNPSLSWIRDQNDLTAQSEIPSLIHGSPALQKQLRSLCIEYKDIFKRTLDGEAALVPPMEIEVDKQK